MKIIGYNETLDEIIESISWRLKYNIDEDNWYVCDNFIEDYEDYGDYDDECENPPGWNCKYENNIANWRIGNMTEVLSIINLYMKFYSEYTAFPIMSKTVGEIWKEITS